MIRTALGLVLLATLLLVLERRCSAEPIRLLIAVSHRTGRPGETPLKHATQDATRVRDVFTRVGGVRPEHAFLLNDPTKAQLLAAIDADPFEG